MGRNSKLLSRTSPERRAHQPVRVLLVGPSLDILGGQSIQAAQLVHHLRGEPSVEVSFVAINPRLSGVLRNVRSIKYVRMVVRSVLYVARLVARIPRHDVIHVFSASHLSFVLAPTPAIVIAKCCRKAILL